MVDFKDIQVLADKIAEQFHPDQIILFGSYAAGTASENSDVDLLVVLPFEGKNFRKSLEIINAVNPMFSADILARRPDDTKWRYRHGDPLIKEALDHGKTLYERNN
ncbi:MAG: nucleotidyltransferase domain-containing protein [Sedimentisphaerales bacterium]|nr:nucleotidyltransferase domain-containing protein [Sedimentisphaerales bacterium]